MKYATFTKMVCREGTDKYGPVWFPGETVEAGRVAVPVESLTATECIDVEPSTCQLTYGSSEKTLHVMVKGTLEEVLAILEAS